jgi:hypothetical protein
MSQRYGYDGPERRTNGWDSGNTLLGGLPGWAKAIAVIGIPGAIAFFLVWMNGRSLPEMQLELTVLGQQNTQIQQLLSEHNRQAEKLQGIMQQVCANTAGKDPLKEQLCFNR